MVHKINRARGCTLLSSACCGGTGRGCKRGSTGEERGDRATHSPACTGEQVTYLTLKSSHFTELECMQMASSCVLQTLGGLAISWHREIEESRMQLPCALQDKGRGARIGPREDKKASYNSSQGAHHNVPQGCLHQPLLCQQPSQTSCMHCEDLERTFAPHMEFSPSASDQAPCLCLPPRTTRLTPCLLSLKQPASAAQRPCHSSSTSEPARWVWNKAR